MIETENQQFKKLHAVSRQLPVLLSGQSPPVMCPPETAALRAAFLVGCYRTGDAADPETYTAAVASILTLYPQAVVYRVTDPRSGLPGKSQWLPTVAEIKAACEAEMPRTRLISKSTSLGPRQNDEDRAAVLEHIRAHHPQLFGVDPARPDAQRPLTAEEIKAKYRIKPVLISRGLMETQHMRGTFDLP